MLNPKQHYWHEYQIIGDIWVDENVAEGRIDWVWIAVAMYSNAKLFDNQLADSKAAIAAIGQKPW